MSLTPSTMLKLGTAAIQFSLLDVRTGEQAQLPAPGSHSAYLVVFLCRHCPYVKHVEHELAKLGRDYASKKVYMVGISANDADAYPDDAPASLAEWARDMDFQFPLLYDESQEVAKAYTAACTPDFFLFDAQQKLIYRGQLDDSRPGNGVPVTGESLRAALDNLLAGQPVDELQKPAMGCNIKWKPGQEPDYF